MEKLDPLVPSMYLMTITVLTLPFLIYIMTNKIFPQCQMEV